MRGEESTNIQIRSFRSADHPAVEHLLHNVWGVNRDAIAYYRYGEPLENDERYLHTLVAEQHGQLMGMGSVWTNRFHPHSAYIGILVDPQHQARGVGSALWERLIVECQPCRRLPLQTATYENQQRARRFLAKRGFRETKRTYQPKLDLQAIDISQLDHHAARVMQAGYTIHTLAELAGDRARDQQVINLFAEIYAAAHPTNPPLDRAAALWHDVVFDDLIEDACFVACKDEQYAALSSLRPHDTPGRMWLDLRGVVEGHRAYQTALILALTQREFIYARQHGIATLQAEIDTDDEGAMVLLQHLPFGSSTAWITFRRERS